MSQPAGKPSLPADHCAKCGACAPVCPIFRLTGRETLAARGKLHLLRQTRPDAVSPYFAELLSQCLLCGACADACPRGLDPPAHFIAARGLTPTSSKDGGFAGYLLKELMARPAACHLLAAPARAILSLLPPDSGLRLRLGLGGIEGDVPLPADLSSSRSSQRHGGENAKAMYFTGCLAAHLEPEIASATDFLVTRLTGSPTVAPAGQACCGLALLSAGDQARAKSLARRNIIAFETSDLPILVSCASCYAHLLHYPTLLADDPDWADRALSFAGRVVEFSRFFVNRGLPDLLAKQHAGNRQKIIWHDPCHLRFGARITKEPRQLLAAAAIVAEPANGPHCCGQGGLFHLAHPEQAATLAGEAIQSFLAQRPAAVLTSCSGCLLHLRQHLAETASAVNARHPAVFLRQLFR